MIELSLCMAVLYGKKRKKNNNRKVNVWFKVLNMSEEIKFYYLTLFLHLDRFSIGCLD